MTGIHCRERIHMSGTLLRIRRQVKMLVQIIHAEVSHGDDEEESYYWPGIIFRRDH